MLLNRQAPPYFFALTPEMENTLPFELAGSKVTPVSFIPARSTEKDTGFDIRCAEPGGMVIKPGQYFKMKLGFRMFAPDGWWLAVYPRSGSFTKLNIHALYGVIDETFEHQCLFAGQYLPDSSRLQAGEELVISFGDRIAQVIPTPRWEMTPTLLSNEELEKKYKERDSHRGEGFHSSGTK